MNNIRFLQTSFVLWSTILCLTMCTFLPCNAQTNQSNPDSIENTKKKDNVIMLQSTLYKPLSHSPTSVDRRSKVVIHIDDVNTFLYKIKIKEFQRDVISDEEFPYELDIDYSLSTIKISPIDITTLTLATSYQHHDAVNELRTLKAEYDFSIREYDRIKQSTESSNDSGMLVKLSAQLDSLENVTSELMHKISIKEIELEAIEDFEQYKIEGFNLLVNEYATSINSLNELAYLYNELLFLLYSNRPFKEILASKQALVLAHFPSGSSISSKKSIYQLASNRISKLESIYLELSKANTTGTRISSVDSIFQKIAEFHRSLPRERLTKLAHNIALVYNSINKANWTIDYPSRPISDKADYVGYKVELTPRDNSYASQSQSLVVPYTMQVTGGFKFDASAGLMFHPQLSKNSYYFRSVTDSTSTVILDSSAGTNSYSAGVLFNVYWRSTLDIKPCLNFGAATDLNQLNYFVGGGLIIGQSERIVVSGGCVGAFINRIDPKYTVGSDIHLPRSDLPDNVPFMDDDELKLSWFIGLTYKFTGKNKETIASMIRD